LKISRNDVLLFLKKII